MAKMIGAHKGMAGGFLVPKRKYASSKREVKEIEAVADRWLWTRQMEADSKVKVRRR